MAARLHTPASLHSGRAWDGAHRPHPEGSARDREGAGGRQPAGAGLRPTALSPRLRGAPRRRCAQPGGEERLAPRTARGLAKGPCWAPHLPKPTPPEPPESPAGPGEGTRGPGSRPPRVPTDAASTGAEPTADWGSGLRLRQGRLHGRLRSRARGERVRPGTGAAGPVVIGLVGSSSVFFPYDGFSDAQLSLT